MATIIPPGWENDQNPEAAKKLQGGIEHLEDLVKKLDKNYDKFKNEFKDLLDDVKKIREQGDKEAKGGGGAGGGDPFKSGFKWGTGLSGMENVAVAITKELNLWAPLFSGIVHQEYAYNMEMRHILRNTQGVTAEARSMQQVYEQMDKSAVETGFNRTDIQYAYLAVLKKGVKSEKETLGITKTSYNLGTMMGTNEEERRAIAEHMNEYLNKANREYGISANQTAEISRQMQAVSVHTGITGNEMLAVVERSDQYVKNMRNANTLSANGAGNVMEMVAQAKKLGVDEEVGKLIEAGTNSVKLYTSASKETQTLMFAAASSIGKLGDLQTGQIFKTKEGIKGMATGIENMVKRFGVDLDNLDKMNPQDLFRVNLQLQAALGVEAGQAKRIIESFREAGKTFQDRVLDINKELQNGNITEEERLQLIKKQNKMQIDKGLEFLNAIDEAGKSANNLSGAVEQATKKLGPELMGDLKQMGVAIGDPISMLKGAAEVTAKKLAEAGGVDMTGQVKSAIDSGKISDVRDLLQQMNKEYQKVGVTEQSQLDPQMRLAQYGKEINDILRTHFGETATWAKSMLTYVGVIPVLLANVVAGIVGLSLAMDAMKAWFAGKGAGGALGALNPFKGGATAAGPTTGLMGETITRTAGNAANVVTAPEKPMAAAATANQATTAPATGGVLKQLESKIPSITEVKGIAIKLAGWAVVITAFAAAVMVLMAALIKIKQDNKLTVKDAIEVGEILTVTFAVAAEVAGAIYLASKFLDGMKIPEKAMADKIRDVAKKFVMLGAVGLGVAAIAMGAMVFMGILTKIKSTFGMTTKDAIEAGEILTVVFAVTAGILAALTFGMNYLNAKQTKDIPTGLGAKLAGIAKNLAIVGVPMALMAAAVGGFLMLVAPHLPNIDEGKVAKLAILGTLMAAAGAIIMGIGQTTEGMDKIGPIIDKLKGNVGKLLKNMAIGGAAMIVLAPAITLLAIGIMRACEIAMLAAPDAATVQKTTDNILALLWATAKILAAITPFAALFAVIGSAGWEELVELGPMMLIGAAAVGAVTAGVITFAAIIGAFCEGVDYVINLDKANKAANGVLDLLWATTKILAACAALAAIFTVAGAIIGGVGSIPFVGWAALGIAAGLMAIGAVTLAAFAGEVILLSVGIMKVCELATLSIDPTKVEQTVKVVEGLSTAVQAISGMMMTFMNTIVAFTASSWNIFDWKSPAQKIKEQTPIFKESLRSIISSTVEMMDSINDNFDDIKSIRRATRVLKLLGSMFATLGPMMTTLGKTMGDFCKGEAGHGFLWLGHADSIKKIFEDNKKEFAKVFESVMAFLGGGVVDSINDNIDNMREVQMAARKMEAIGKVLGTISGAFGNLGKVMEDFTGDQSHWLLRWKNKEGIKDIISENKEGFKTGFEDIVKLLNGPIMNTIDGIKGVKEIAGGAKKIEKLSSVLSSVVSMMDALQKLMARTQGGKEALQKLDPKAVMPVDIDTLRSSFIVFKDSFIPLMKELEKNSGIMKQIAEIKEPKELGAASKKLERLGSFVNSISKLANTIGKIVAPGAVGEYKLQTGSNRDAGKWASSFNDIAGDFSEFVKAFTMTLGPHVDHWNNNLQTLIDATKGLNFGASDKDAKTAVTKMKLLASFINSVSSVASTMQNITSTGNVGEVFTPKKGESWSKMFKVGMDFDKFVSEFLATTGKKANDANGGTNWGGNLQLLINTIGEMNFGKGNAKEAIVKVRKLATFLAAVSSITEAIQDLSSKNWMAYKTTEANNIVTTSQVLIDFSHVVKNFNMMLGAEGAQGLSGNIKELINATKKLDFGNDKDPIAAIHKLRTLAKLLRIVGSVSDVFSNLATTQNVPVDMTAIGARAGVIAAGLPQVVTSVNAILAGMDKADITGTMGQVKKLTEISKALDLVGIVSKVAASLTGQMPTTNGTVSINILSQTAIGIMAISNAIKDLTINMSSLATASKAVKDTGISLPGPRPTAQTVPTTTTDETIINGQVAANLDKNKVIPVKDEVLEKSTDEQTKLLKKINDSIDSLVTLWKTKSEQAGANATGTGVGGTTNLPPLSVKSNGGYVHKQDANSTSAGKPILGGQLR